MTKSYKDQAEITKVKEALLNKIFMEIYNTVHSFEKKEWPN